MTYPVKYMTSDFVGAPRCSGTAGDMVALLDACLVNGFNIMSVVTITVVDEVATVDYGTAHGYIDGQIIRIDGVTTPLELNGEKYVASATTSELTFDAPGVADGSASGTISCRTAPVGDWEKSYSGVNKAVYRSTDITGTQLYLRVDDTNGQYAICRGYETMTDVDVGTGAFPTVVEYPNGYVWKKSKEDSTVSKPWVLVGDSLMFYLFVAWHPSYDFVSTYRYGDVVSHKQADGYNCQIGGHANDLSPAYMGTNNEWDDLTGVIDAHIARSHTQVGSAVQSGKYGSSLSNRFGDQGSIIYPNLADNSLLLHSPIAVVEDSGTVVRGIMPGILQPIQESPLSHLDILSDIAPLPGRRLLIIATSSGLYYEGRTAVDITGPWR